MRPYQRFLRLWQPDSQNGGPECAHEEPQQLGQIPHAAGDDASALAGGACSGPLTALEQLAGAAA